MRVGEEKKDGNRYQDSSLLWRAAQSLTHRRSKARSHSPVWNRNTWLSFKPSRSRSGSTAFSEKLVTTSAIKMSFTATIKAQSPSHIIRSTTLVRNISTSNTTSLETVAKMEQHVWNTVRQRTWWRTD